MANWVILAFVLVQVVVTVIVVRTMISRGGGLSSILGADLQSIMEVSKQMELETEEYLRANWSGDPATLPVALNALLDRFESRVRERRLPITRAELRPMLGRLVLQRRLAKGHDVNEALKQVA